ncbi:MAG: hypothetical protein ABSF53_16075 [Terracidiphilus sp.]|jgi:hypothetical protein
MLKAYVDESGDSSDNVCNFVGLGGITAHEKSWGQFEITWKDALDEFIGGEPFHMKDYVCVPGHGIYKDWAESKRIAFMGKLVSSILAIKPRFVGCVVSIPDFKNLPPVLQISLRDPYFVGFQEVTRGLSILAEVDGIKPITMIYSIHLKHGATEAGMAQQLWMSMKEQSENRAWMGPYSIGSPSTCYALQAADLFAYELTQEFEHICDNSGRKMRWPMRQFILNNENNFFVNAFTTPVFHEVARGLGGDVFKTFQQNVMRTLNARAKQI